MRGAFSYLIIFFAVGVSTILIPVERLLSTLTDTEDMVESAKEADLHGELVTAMSASLENRNLHALKESSLAWDRNELSGMIRSAFPAEWFYQNLAHVHRGAIDGSSNLSVNLSDRKELLADNVGRWTEEHLQNLPDCDRNHWGRLPQSTDSLVIPPCKPPAWSAKLVVLAVESQTRAGLRVFPDTLNLASSTSEAITDSFRYLHELVITLKAGSYGFLLVLFLLLVIINRRHPGDMWFRVGITCILTGILVGTIAYLLHVALGSSFQQAEATEDMKLRLGDSTFLLPKEFAQPVWAFLEGWMSQYVRNMFILTGLFVVPGFIALAIRHFATQPEAPLRKLT